MIVSVADDGRGATTSGRRDHRRAPTTGRRRCDRAGLRSVPDAGSRQAEVTGRLVEAARELVARAEGPTFTVTQVVAAAGTSLKSFYRCFASKDELLVALFEDDARRGADALRSMVDVRAEPLERLRIVVVGLFRFLTVEGRLPYAAGPRPRTPAPGRVPPRPAPGRAQPLRRRLRGGAVRGAGRRRGACRRPRRDARTLFHLVLSHLHALICHQIEEPADRGGRRAVGVLLGGTAPVTGVLLPDPAPRPITVPVISVDDHLIEPPDMFEGRMPAHLAERAPRVVERDDGVQSWLYEGRSYPNVGLNAVAGRRRDTWSMDPSRFDEMRPGCYDIDARIADMDINGVWASLCFPSLVAGFCGLGLLTFGGPRARAWPACGPGTPGTPRSGPGRYPQRIIPLQLPWLADVAVATGVRRNAALGFKAVSFPEFPARLGVPSIFSGHGTRSSRRARRPPRSSACTPAPRAGPRCRRPTRPSSSSRRCSPSTPSWPRPSGCGRACPFASPISPSPCPRGGSAGCRCCSTGPTTSSNIPPRAPKHVLAVGAASERGPAPELLVLHHRRPVDDRAAAPDRRRPHHGGERLPPRRLHLARHPDRPREDPRPPSRRRAPDDGRGERGAPVPPSPAARGRLARLVAVSDPMP